ncbi:MAG: GldG family protein, partial [Myxococcaceae bacterium]|nr:GldG family protein [Myxococcaceae bacterium]
MGMRRFSAAIGATGLLLVFTSPLTLGVMQTSLAAFWVKLVLGLLLVGVWAVLNGQKIATWARTVFYFSSSALIGLAFVALLIGANFILARRNQTWDLTNKKLNSLSQQTRDTLASLSEPVRVYVFATEALPDTVEDLLRKYAAETPRFTWERVNPRKAFELVARYKIREQDFAAVLVRNPDTPTEASAKASLPALADPGKGEAELTNALIRLVKVGEQHVYFLEGHGELPLEAPKLPDESGVPPNLERVRAALTADGYDVAGLNLVEKGQIPTDAAALVIAGARAPFTEGEKRLLEQYLDEGGRLLYFAAPQAEPGLDAVLAKYGVQIDNGLVADPRLEEKQPYFIVTPFFGEHELVAALKATKMNVYMEAARSITVLREGTLPGVKATAAVLTTPDAWLETKLDQPPDLDAGEKSGQLAVVTVSTRDVSAATARSPQT